MTGGSTQAPPGRPWRWIAVIAVALVAVFVAGSAVTYHRYVGRYTEPHTELLVESRQIRAFDHDPVAGTLYLVEVPSGEGERSSVLSSYDLATGETSVIDDGLPAILYPWVGVAGDGEVWLFDDGWDPMSTGMGGAAEQALLVYRDGTLVDRHPVHPMDGPGCASIAANPDVDRYLGLRPVRHTAELEPYPMFVIRTADDGALVAYDPGSCDERDLADLELYVSGNLQALNERALLESMASSGWSWVDASQGFRYREQGKLFGFLQDLACARVFDRVDLDGTSYRIGSCFRGIHEFPSSGHLFTDQGDLLYRSGHGIHVLRR